MVGKHRGHGLWADMAGGWEDMPTMPMGMQHADENLPRQPPLPTALVHQPLTMPALE